MSNNDTQGPEALEADGCTLSVMYVSIFVAGVALQLIYPVTHVFMQLIYGLFILLSASAIWLSPPKSLWGRFVLAVLLALPSLVALARMLFA